MLKKRRFEGARKNMIFLPNSTDCGVGGGNISTFSSLPFYDRFLELGLQLDQKWYVTRLR